MAYAKISRWMASFVGLNACFLLAGCGYSPQSQRSANASEPGRSVAVKSEGPPTYEHDFGVVRPSDKVSHCFVVKNTSSMPWKLEGITRSCSCSVVVPKKQIINPGEVDEFQFDYQVSSKPDNGHQSATVHFKGPADEEILVVLRVVARVRDVLTIQPGEMAFGQVALNSKDFRVIRIENYSNAAWESVQFPALPSSLALIGLEKTQESADSLPRQVWKAEFQIDTVGLDIKSFQSALNVATVPAGPVASIPVSFTVIDGINVTPSILNFGKIKPGETAQAKLLVRINGKHQGTFSSKSVTANCESGRAVALEWNADSKELWVLTVRLTNSSASEELVTDALTLRFPSGIADRRIAMNAWMMPK